MGFSKAEKAKKRKKKRKRNEGDQLAGTRKNEGSLCIHVPEEVKTEMEFFDTMANCMAQEGLDEINSCSSVEDEVSSFPSGGYSGAISSRGVGGPMEKLGKI